MKVLHLFRHAKSPPALPGQEDFDRGLTKRGERNTPDMAEAMLSRGIRPSLVLCSPAARTRQTLDLLGDGFADADAVVFDRRLYHADPEEILATLRAHDAEDRHAVAMVVGHNPGLHQLAQWISGNRESEAYQRLLLKLPTCALATLTLQARSWKEVRLGTGVLTEFLRPRDLTAAPDAEDNDDD